MAFTGTQVVERTSFLLNDATKKRWTEPELILWINDAISEIVIRRPPAGAKTETFTCAAGTKQIIPANGITLMDVIRNVDGSNNPGRAIRRVDRQTLDDISPSWHADTQATAAKHYVFDERNPKDFYLWPPVQVGVKIDISYAKKPDNIDALGDSIDFDDWYLQAAASYVAWRALSKDSEYANGAQATAMYQAFNDSLGTQNSVGQAVSPNQASV